MPQRLRRGIRLCAALVLCLGLFNAHSFADTSSSTNFQLEETTIGTGNLEQSNSSNFKVDQSVGDTGVGNSASDNFQIDGGSQTTPDPTLTMTINTANVNFGNFSATATAVATTTFTIINYTSYGYVVQIVGDSPSNGSHTIPAMTTTGPSIPGTEQFGINLVANTSPTSIGANPVYGPFGVGSASGNYGTSNQYRFVSGETIASAPKSSGDTTYTITYIINVESITPGGKYTSAQTVVCTGTY